MARGRYGERLRTHRDFRRWAYRTEAKRLRVSRRAVFVCSICGHWAPCLIHPGAPEVRRRVAPSES
jgi:hypothetical protein